MVGVVSFTALDLSGEGSLTSVVFDNYSAASVTATDLVFRYTLGGVPVMEMAVNGRFNATSSGNLYGSLSAIAGRYPDGSLMVEIGGINQSFSSSYDFSRILSNSVMFSKADAVYGSAQADRLYSRAGNDLVFGGAGNDTIDGGSGSDVIDGGAGIDLSIAGTSYAADRVVRNNGRTVVMDGYGTVDSYTDVEYLQFTNGTLASSAVPSFDAMSYIASYPDLIAAYGLNTDLAFNHYVQWGYAAGRRPGGFDAMSYLASHPELVAAYGIDEQAATAHYIQWGKAAGWGITFNPQSYMRANPDVAAAVNGNAKAAAVNYILWGRAGGRPTASSSAAPVELQAGADALVIGALASSTSVAASFEERGGAPLAVVADLATPGNGWREGAALSGAMAATDPLLVPVSTDAWGGGALSVAAGFALG